jgi:hypothetical protein
MLKLQQSESLTTRALVLEQEVSYGKWMNSAIVYRLLISLVLVNVNDQIFLKHL